MSRHFLVRSFRAALAVALLSCTETTAPDTTVATVSVSVPRPMVRVGESIQATAKALNAGGSELNITSVTWTSSDVSIATISSTGLVTALAPGDVTLQATTDGKVGAASLKITIVPVFSITISSTSSTVSVGQIISLSAIAKDSAGNALSGRTITWTTSDQTRAIVSSSGVVIGVAAGSVDVTASAEGKSASTHLNVTLPSPSSVASVSVSIARTAFRVGETLQAAALPLDASGGVLTGRTINWSSSDPEVATVSSGGLVTGVGPGNATITAEVEGKTGTSFLQLSLVPVASVTITPPSETISAGATATLTAVLKDSANRILTGRKITWSSSNTNVAPVSQDGVVTATLIGTADIVATVEGKQATATITVNTVNTSVATVTLSPANTNMSGGGTKQLTATLRDANGNILSGRTVTWSSSNPDRATVSSTGVVTAAVVDAPVVITATAEGKAGVSSIGIVTLVKMSAGSGNCGLIADGTPWCWSYFSPDPVQVSTDVKFSTISTGSNFTCGIAMSGSTYCWGVNASGQLGNGATSTRSDTPVLVSGNYTFLSVAAGGQTACATTPQNEVYCWGQIIYRDDLPPDGHTNYVAQTVPMLVGSGMVAVVAGLSDQFCSVDAAGLAYCWTPKFTYTSATHTTTPPIGSPVSTSVHFTTLRVGFDHVCGLVASGEAWCWGKNTYGQLGNGTTQDRATPTPVTGGLTFQALAAGGGTIYLDSPNEIGTAHPNAISCGLTQSGAVYCWGSNGAGEAGVGTAADIITSPQPLAGGISFTGLRGGLSHVCGLASGGVAYCWGVISSTRYGGVYSRVAVPVFGK